MSNPGVMEGTPIPLRALFKEFFIIIIKVAPACCKVQCFNQVIISIFSVPFHSGAFL